MQDKQRRRTLRDFLALKHNIVVLLGALLVIGMGEELWVRFMPKYLEVLGASALAIGAYGSFKRVVDTVYQYPGGWLADRFGRKRALVFFNLIAAMGYLVYLLTRSWEIVILGTLLVLAWSSMSQPAIFALIGDNLGRDKRAMGFSVQSIWKRIPIVLAPPIGGYLLTRFGVVSGMHIGFLVSLLFALAAIYLQSRFYREKPRRHTEQREGIVTIWRRMPGALRQLLLADCFARFGSSLTAVYVVLLVINIRGVSLVAFGALTSAQMLTAIAGYIPAAHYADRFGRRPFILVTFALFALFPIILVGLPAEWLIVAFVAAGLRELGEPARKALIVDLADASRRGRVIGFYYLIRGLVTIPAPLLGGLLWQRGYTWPFVVGGAISAIGFGIYYVTSARTIETSDV
jgi:MFS family permease